LTSSGNIHRTLRRLKPALRRGTLRRRDRAELTFIDPYAPVPAQGPKLLLDTTVYIDELQAKLSADFDIWLRSTVTWHSTVTESELLTMIGLLDPNHPQSAGLAAEVTESIERRPPQRIVNPDRETWREAGIVAGLLARLQQYGKAEQRRVLNDALLFFSASRAGLTVLTRNVSDFDLLQQLVPSGQVIFYDI
jgi:predicted nucleic acid-binding protein